MNDVMKHFRPKDSPYFGTLEKITTITPENGQFIFGDPNWVGNTSDIREFTVESLFEKIEPVLLPPVTEYRVTKKNGAFFILDTREAAERVAAQESDTEESLEIVERTYRPVLSNPPNRPPELLRISLPPDIKSVDIFQVLSVAAFTYGVFGYFAKFSEPESEGMGYREQTILGLSTMSTACITILDAAEAENVELGEEGWSFQGKEVWGDDRDHSYDSVFSSAIVLDDGNPRGILVGTQGSGTYSFRAVYEGEDDEASLIGVLVLTSGAGPQVLSDEEILEEKDWNDGVNAIYVANEYEEQGDYEKAFRWYEISAEQGNPYGQSYLGQFCQVGLGVEKDETEAVKWFRLAAGQGNATGLWELGDCYQQGQGVEEDLEKAFECFRKSYDIGDDSRAVASLGYCYFEGIGVKRDFEKACSLFRESAEAGDVDGQFYLARRYQDGDGVEKDIDEAVKWYRAAADQGDATSQWFLARCYQDGEGVERDFDEAVKWFRAAAEQGDEDAEYELEWGERSQDDDEVESRLKWIRSGVEQGSGEAMYALACCYKTGYGVEKDPEEAEKWLVKAKKLAAERPDSDQ
jgi:tetratricopeptide (TPR) repeat protein